jgi:uncharacterized membrane protein YgcG
MIGKCNGSTPHQDVRKRDDTHGNKQKQTDANATWHCYAPCAECLHCNANTMNTRLLTLSLSLIAATVQVAPVWADDAAAVTLQRPLNLTLPREARQLPSMTFDNASVDPVERNLRATQIRDGRNVERLPYGSGFEARQRGASHGNGNTSSGGGGGGRGRGGMGRGR